MIRMAVAIGITLAALLAASAWLHDRAWPHSPIPLVRTDPAGRLAELRAAASSWVSEQSAELERALPLPPRLESEGTQRVVAPEVDADGIASLSVPLPDSAGQNAPLARNAVLPEIPVSPAPSQRDLDRSGETVRCLLALYARLEARP